MCDGQVEARTNAHTLRRNRLDRRTNTARQVRSRGDDFAQGDPAASILYVEMGAVRLSVLSHAGKEAVVAMLDAGHFFGEGCLAGQTQRMATATAMASSTILAVEKPDMVRQRDVTLPRRRPAGRQGRQQP
jgi:CRP-like cAMP-binding protein